MPEERDPAAESSDAGEPAAGTREIAFLESMPRPLVALFLLLAAGGVGLVIFLMIRPPTADDVALELRRSPPRGTLTHEVVGAILVPIPDPLPAFTPPCPAFSGVVIEGGPPAQARLGSVLRSLCPLARPGVPSQVSEGLRGLDGARLRFARFTRTGDQSTADIGARRVLLDVSLARSNVPPIVLAPLLVHEGWHLSHADAGVTARQEYLARVAELGACRLLIAVDRFPRGCQDAESLVQLGEERAVEALARGGYPR